MTFIDHPVVIEALSRFWPRMKGFSTIDLNKALTTADDAHGDRTRIDGRTPWLFNLIETAIIADTMKHDETLVIAALLHDVLETTELTQDDLAHEFGHDVGFIVKGVSGEPDKTDPDWRKLDHERMLTDGWHDDRILLVKLASCLYGMRTLQDLTQHKQRAKAQDTMDYIVPLAHKLKQHAAAEELETICRVIFRQDEQLGMRVDELLHDVRTYSDEAARNLVLVRNALSTLFRVVGNSNDMKKIQQIMKHVMNTEFRLNYSTKDLRILEDRLRIEND